MIFNNKGQIIDREVTNGISKALKEYIESQYYLVDLSALYDYCSKKVRFKPDNFTDVTMRTYIQDLEDKYLINQRKLNKSC